MCPAGTAQAEKGLQSHPEVRNRRRLRGLPCTGMAREFIGQPG